MGIRPGRVNPDQVPSDAGPVPCEPVEEVPQRRDGNATPSYMTNTALDAEAKSTKDGGREQHLVGEWAAWRVVVSVVVDEASKACH